MMTRKPLESGNRFLNVNLLEYENVHISLNIGSQNLNKANTVKVNSKTVLDLLAKP